ncbi:MAG TPA: hydroxyethylthiazole kinase [Polyangiales bacterium]|nr:hydroxyethylthiazole kinase [Polyangiales bacterium]
MSAAEPSIDSAHVLELLTRLREQNPLVQNITNYVAMTLSANVLLAVGASPAMVHAVEEVEAFVGISSSLVINIGTLSPTWVEGMRLAATRARALGKPWVLDPVGCGATPYRTSVAVELAALKPAIIRGNGSEILALAGSVGGGKGVDSTAASDEALAAAVALSKRTGAVVAVTGAIDYATDGERVVAIASGDPLMTRSTGLGCALSATTAAFAAVAPPLAAASAALAVYGAAGKAAAHSCKGPGHLPAELCDALVAMNAELLARHAKISTRAFP